MRSLWLIGVVLMIATASCGSYKSLYQVNEKGDGIYYESTLKFEGIPKEDILKQTKKFLENNEYKIRYEDDTEIHATGGDFEVSYIKVWVLFFYNKKYYACKHDIKFKIQDNQIKYKADEFLLKGKYKDVAIERVDKLYRKGKTEKRHRVFPSVQKEMELLEEDLAKTIRAPKERW